MKLKPKDLRRISKQLWKDFARDVKATDAYNRRVDALVTVFDPPRPPRLIRRAR